MRRDAICVLHVVLAVGCRNGDKSSSDAASDRVESGFTDSSAEIGQHRCLRDVFHADAGYPPLEALIKSECARSLREEFHNVRVCKRPDGSFIVATSDIDTGTQYYFNRDGAVTGLEGWNHAYHGRPVCTVAGSAADESAPCEFTDPCSAKREAGAVR